MMMTTIAPIQIFGQVGPAMTDQDAIYQYAQTHAALSQTPCGVWERRGVFAASEAAPDFDELDTREEDGWELVAVVDPTVD